MAEESADKAEVFFHGRDPSGSYHPCQFVRTDFGQEKAIVGVLYQTWVIY